MSIDVDVDRLRVDAEYWDSVAPVAKDGGDVVYSIDNGLFYAMIDGRLHCSVSKYDEWTVSCHSSISVQDLDEYFKQPTTKKTEFVESLTDQINSHEPKEITDLSKSIDNIARDIKQYAQANNLSVENVFYCLHLLCGGEKL